MNKPAKQRTRATTNLTAVEGGAADPKPKRTRKSKATLGFADQLREIVAVHKSKIAALVESEQKLEASLAAVRSMRERAEGPLREVEAMLANYPALPLEQPEAGPPPHDEPAPHVAAGEAVSP